VEHWRPKGGVINDNGDEIEPGYYWLAAEWNNLLPSCADCNRERRQITLPTGEVVLSGKAEHFPLDDESRRATSLAELRDEAPLLLDPSTDEPKEHIEFFERDNQKALLRALGG